MNKRGKQWTPRKNEEIFFFYNDIHFVKGPGVTRGRDFKRMKIDRKKRKKLVCLVAEVVSYFSLVSKVGVRSND